MFLPPRFFFLVSLSLRYNHFAFGVINYVRLWGNTLNCTIYSISQHKYTWERHTHMRVFFGGKWLNDKCQVDFNSNEPIRLKHFFCNMLICVAKWTKAIFRCLFLFILFRLISRQGKYISHMTHSKISTDLTIHCSNSTLTGDGFAYDFRLAFAWNLINAQFCSCGSLYFKYIEFAPWDLKKIYC